MDYKIIKNQLKLKYPIFGVTRTVSDPSNGRSIKGCIYKVFDMINENKVVFNSESVTCKGACVGCGFVDGVPNIPGGFGHFLSKGRGEGFPSGERIKCCPEVGERMLLAQPQNVMDGYNAIEIEAYKEDLEPELILFLVTPDQLSGLLTLFYYRNKDYDRVIVPISSGCAQLFRIPFGELKKENPKAVLGNTDFFSRPHLDKDLLAFTVPSQSFKEMCEDASECCFFSPAWNGVKKRL